MKLTPIQSDFSVGELTPLMGSRSDSDVYGSALSVLTNMIPDAHGPAVGRDGMEWLVRVSGSVLGRIYIFEISNTEFWILLFDGTNMYSYNTSGTSNTVAWAQDGNGLAITTGNPAVAALNGTDIALHQNSKLRTYRFNGTDWAQVGNGLAIVGTTPALAALNGTDVAFYDIAFDELRTYRFNGTNWALVGTGLSIVIAVGVASLTALNGTDVAYFDSVNKELRTYRFDGANWALVGAGLAIATSSVSSLAALNGTDIALIDSNIEELRTYRFDGAVWAQVGNGLLIDFIGISALTALNGTDVALVDSSINELRTYRWDGTDWAQIITGLSIATVGNPAITALDGTSIAFIDSTNDELRTYETGSTGSISVPWAAADLEDLQFIPDPNGVRVTVVHPSNLPWEIFYDQDTSSIRAMVSNYASVPTNWAADKYPSCGCIYQSRLWLAFKTTVWATRNDNRNDFTQGTTAVDGFEFVRDQYGNVSWLQGENKLLMGTETGEYAISAQAGIVYIGDISVDRQSSYGSKGIQAKQLADKMAYITVDGRKCQAMSAIDNTSQYLSDDLSFLSEHITLNGIKDFVWQRHPNTIAWFTDLSGNFLCMTFNRSANKYGWGSCNTQGTIISLATGSINGETKLVALVTRNGADLDLEVFNPVARMDSYIAIAIGASTDVITGLTHLEGKTVKVKVDDWLHPDRTVSGGQITLQKEVANVTVYVGLGYSQILKTLHLDRGSVNGSGRSHLKKWKDIYVDLVDSGLPKINDQYPADRSIDTPMGTPSPLISDFIKVNDLDFTKPAYVEVKQEEPLPLIVSAIYGEISQDKS